MQHLSTLTLNQLRYGELDADQAASARTHIDACERCAARLRGQQAHRAAFEVEPVPAAIRALRPKPSRWRWIFAALLPAFAAALVLFSLRAPPTLTEIEDTRPKGAAVELEAWLDTPQGPKLLEEGDFVSPGDVVQLRFDAGPMPWVTFAGEDSTGAVEIYATLPSRGESSGIRRAPFGLTLDETPGAQRFYALFTQTRPTPEGVKRVIERQTPPPDGTLRMLTLQKR